MPPSKVPDTTGGDITGFAAELNRAKARIAELKSVVTITVRRQEELLDEAKRRHIEDVTVWRKTSAENVNSPVKDEKVAKAESVKVFVEWNLTLARFEKHVIAL